MIDGMENGIRYRVSEGMTDLALLPVPGIGEPSRNLWQSNGL